MICSRCQKDLPPDQFFLRNVVTGKRHSQCKTCYKAVRVGSHAAHYQKHAEEYRRRARERRDRVRREIREKLLQYLKEHPCEQCSEDDPVVLDFDHKDPSQKSFTISSAARLGKSWKQILAEIKKCQVLCANCHRRRSAKQCSSHKLS